MSTEIFSHNVSVEFVYTWKGAPVLAMAGHTVTSHAFCPGTQETFFAPPKLLTL